MQLHNHSSFLTGNRMGRAELRCDMPMGPASRRQREASRRRSVITGACVLVVGAALSSAGIHDAGGALSLLGAGWLGGLTAGWWRERRAEAAEQHRSRKRAELRAVRRERNAGRRAAARAERARRVVDTARTRGEMAAARQQSAMRRSEAHRERLRRGDATAVEARRLASLTDAALHQALAQALQARGMSAEPQQDYPGDLLVAAADGARIVVRCLPARRRAARADVDALDAWRRTAKASEGYLVSVAGFTEQAVRAVPKLPLQLIDGHVLASWLVGTDEN